ncbi:hypothetical protein HYDPIDRAFT_126768 [Hydnomerulius pinastri MD-312]|nr:hypothetical protein HYDPIDRAFT_126768 [Hydnomerulius pinastri MD-312]
MQSFPPPELISYIGLVLITDELHAPADFLIHRFLNLRLKDAKQTRCLMLSVSEGLERIKAVASKSNLNLSQNGRFKFIDLNAQLEVPVETGLASNESRLRSVYDLVSSELRNALGGDGKSLVILDDIASLEWLGFSALDLSRFCRALKVLCLKSNATLVIRHHILNPSEPDPLFHSLQQLCSYHVEVRPLASGRSGAVSGEVCLHVGPVESEPSLRLIARPTALQYRLTDGGAIFFEKGTSEGVL